MGLKKILSKVGQIVAWPFVHLWPIIRPTATKLLKTELGKIAFAVVKDLANTELTNAEKLAAAQKDIVAQAIASGIEYKDSMVNFLIELAVQALKNGFSV